MPKTVNIVVPHGGMERVAGGLADAGVIDSPFRLRVAAWLTRHDGPIHAAEFTFPAHASLNQVLAVLRTAKPVMHRWTIAEGLTAHQIAALLSKAEAVTGETPHIDEGSLLAETYAYEYGATREQLAQRARIAMTRALETAWADRAPSLPLAVSRDAVILASIVERETSKPEERPHVAAVYLNRLRQGMRLQADPTVVYAASGGTGVLDHKLTRADLDRDAPFNTYRRAGLPAGPICAPSLASLKAVLHPMDSTDLYFVADGTGGHVFAATREAHERNVLRWRAVVASRAAHGSPD